MTTQLVVDASERKTNIILAVVNSEVKMYRALRLLVANELVRDANKDFFASLQAGLSKYGTLTENQRSALARTLRSYGDELVAIQDAARQSRADGGN